MSYQARIIVAGIGAVVAFDLIASLASHTLGFAYARASLGSYLLYLVIGYCAARGVTESPVQFAALAAAIAGLADVSIGWAISWRLGVGKLPAGTTLIPARWMSTAIVVVCLAAAAGALGGLAGRRPPAVDAPAA